MGLREAEVTVRTFFSGSNPSKQSCNWMLPVHEQTGACSCHRLSLSRPPWRLCWGLRNGFVLWAYGPFNLQNGKDTRYTHRWRRWTGGFGIPSSQDRLGVQPTATDSEIRTSTDGDQLEGLGRVKGGTDVFVFFTGCFVEERTYGFCVPFKLWVASHFKFQEPYRMPPADTQAARKIVTDEKSGELFAMLPAEFGLAQLYYLYIYIYM